MKRLPIGISTLAKMRTENYVYIDKTMFVERLRSGYYFLSRPRRFGKSLFLDTLKQAFLGNKEVFKGLHLENNWDWNTKYPVIHLDMGEGVIQSRQMLHNKINESLDYHYEAHELVDKYTSPDGRFKYLIHQLFKKYNQQVVVLIDEYDKPILDNIDKADIAIENREGLKNFYSVIKSNDDKLRLVFFTGVSKFSKVSLFSGLNNLLDITIDLEYADICGYTQQELEASFKEHLLKGQVDLERLKKWYNGYNFGGNEFQKVYNPFDILLFLANGYQYRNYWFETATPTFLIKYLSENRQNLFALERLEVVEDILSSFDIGEMPLETLMWQTGYLTILDSFDDGFGLRYILSYPNYEVKVSINRYLSRIGTTATENNFMLTALTKATEEGNAEKICQLITQMFACIPYQWYRNNKISEYEGFYASVVYCYFTAIGFTTKAEDATNAGSIDLVIDSGKNIFILEFKLSKYGTAKDALQQIKEKGYAKKYSDREKELYLLGIRFCHKERNVKEYALEKWQEKKI